MFRAAAHCFGMVRFKSTVSFKRVYEGVIAPVAGGEAPRPAGLRGGNPPPPETIIEGGNPVRAFNPAAVLERYVSNMIPEYSGGEETPPAPNAAPSAQEVLALLESRGVTSSNLNDLKRLRRELALDCHPDRNRHMDPRIMMLANSKIDALIASAVRRKRSVR